MNAITPYLLVNFYFLFRIRPSLLARSSEPWSTSRISSPARRRLSRNKPDAFYEPDSYNRWCIVVLAVTFPVAFFYSFNCKYRLFVDAFYTLTNEHPQRRLHLSLTLPYLSERSYLLYLEKYYFYCKFLFCLLHWIVVYFFNMVSLFSVYFAPTLGVIKWIIRVDLYTGFNINRLFS